MGLWDRMSRLVRSNVNHWINQSEDPEKVLEQTVRDMQDDLIQLRQGVAQSIATQKRTERQRNQAQSMAEEWYRRAQLALQKGDEAIAREALSRRNGYQQTAETLAQQAQQQSTIVQQLRKNMLVVEQKLNEAKMKKDMYLARARSAKASVRLNEMMGNLGTGEALAAFERMEEKVLELEAQSEATGLLVDAGDLEKEFQSLESGDAMDAEIAAMKAQLKPGDS